MQSNRHQPPPPLSSDAAMGPIAAVDPLLFNNGFSATQMELVNAPNNYMTNMRQRSDRTSTQVHDYNNKVDELSVKVDKLEHGVNLVEQFYSNANVKDPNALTSNNKGEEQHTPSMKRMQELMHQFGSIIREITQHKLAWPFMLPVDVEGLGLHDYYQVIERPMDFSTIKKQMEAKDGTGYKHVREIYSDLRLVFKNAMKYNDENHDVHVMAKRLLEILEDKWLHFLPKVTKEEKIRDAERNVQQGQEAAYEKLARNISNELYDIDMHLEELRELVVKKCRRISSVEKRKLGAALCKLDPEDLSKALEIVAQNNPNFQASDDEVELDLNDLSESTLWRLKLFVKDVSEDECKNDNNDNNARDDANNKQHNNIVSKRKREICNALAKTAKRRMNKSTL